MRQKENAAFGAKTEAALEELRKQNLTYRLARTKALLCEAYDFEALSFDEAESIAARLRRRFPFLWRRA